MSSPDPRVVQLTEYRLKNPSPDQVKRVLSQVESKVLADIEAFKPAADASGSSAILRPKGNINFPFTNAPIRKGDVNLWLKEQAQQDRIKALAQEGFEAYQIAEMLKGG